MAVLRVAFLSSTVLELFAALGVALVAVYVGFSLLGAIAFGAWATPLTVAEAVFLLLLAPEFFQPLRDLAAAWHDRASALAVSGELVAAERAEPVKILGQGATAEIESCAAKVLSTRAVRVRLVEGQPFSHLTTHVPADIARNYSEADLANTPLLKLMESLRLVIRKI